MKARRRGNNDFSRCLQSRGRRIWASRRERRTCPSTDSIPKGDPLNASTAAAEAATTTPTTPASSAPAPDLAAVKQRQQATWASGDYPMIGTQIQVVSELLIEALDIHSDERILDVATGSGNAALAAARRGATVVGIDYVPALLDRARRRRDAEGLDAQF